MKEKTMTKPTKKAPSRKRSKEPSAEANGARVTGKVILAPLASVKPNGWNPNRMTEYQVESTRDGMRRHGWLVSHSLLVWGTDEKGKKRNLIIDGEHRWRIGCEMGFDEGPMVFLERVTKKQAQELTIELAAKRGDMDDAALRDVLGQIGIDDGLAFRLGFSDEDMKALLDGAAPVLAPEDFSDVNIDAKTDYRCPKCSYEWSGAPSAKAKAKRKRRDERKADSAAAAAE